MAATDEKLKLCHEVFSFSTTRMPELEQRVVRCTAGSEEPRMGTDGRDADRDGNRDRNRKYNAVCWHVALVMLITTMVLALLWAIYLSLDWYTCTPEQRFAHMRNDLVRRERRTRIGGKLMLDPLEEIVNERLLWLRSRDEQKHHNWQAYRHKPYNFTQHKLNETDLYGLLRGMPKGGLLHVHDVGAVRLDLLLELTRAADLWTCLGADGFVEDFRFSLLRPESHLPCQWMPMSTFRQQQKNAEEKLLRSFVLSGQKYDCASQLGRHLRRTQRLVHGLIMYRPQWPLVALAMLEDFYADGVTYVELRSSLPAVSEIRGTLSLPLTAFLLLPQLYDLSDTKYSLLDTASMLFATANIFGEAHNDFIGLRLIYSPPRSSNNSQLELYLQQGRLLKVPR